MLLLGLRAPIFSSMGGFLQFKIPYNLQLMNTYQRIRGIIATTLNISESVVTESLSAGEIEQWDSMGNMAIIAAIEQELGIEFPIDDLFELNSVQSLIDEIDKIS